MRNQELKKELFFYSSFLPVVKPQDSNSSIEILPFRRPQGEFCPMRQYLSKCLYTTESKKVMTGPKEQRTQDEVSNCGRHVFLMDSSANANGHCNEASDEEKANRAKFVQNIMLSLLQNLQH